MLAIGVLESRYKKNISEEEAVKLALSSINSAIQRDSASGDGVDVCVINQTGVKKVHQKELKVSLLD